MHHQMLREWLRSLLLLRDNAGFWYIHVARSYVGTLMENKHRRKSPRSPLPSPQRCFQCERENIPRRKWENLHRGTRLTGWKVGMTTSCHVVTNIDMINATLYKRPSVDIEKSSPIKKHELMDCNCKCSFSIVELKSKSEAMTKNVLQLQIWFHTVFSDSFKFDTTLRRYLFLPEPKRGL